MKNGHTWLLDHPLILHPPLYCLLANRAVCLSDDCVMNHFCLVKEGFTGWPSVSRPVSKCSGVVCFLVRKSERVPATPSVYYGGSRSPGMVVAIGTLRVDVWRHIVVESG